MKTGIQIKSETAKIDSYQKVKGSCMAYGSLGGLQHTYSPRYPQRIQKMLSRLVLVKLTKLNTMYSMKVKLNSSLIKNATLKMKNNITVS